MREDSPYRKPLIYGLIAVLVVLSFVIISNTAINIMKDRITDQVSSELFTDSEVHIESISISLLPLSLAFHDIELHTQPGRNENSFQKPGDLLRDLNIERIDVNGIGLFRYLFRDQLNIKSIHIHSPQIDLFADENKLDKLRDESSGRDSELQLSVSEIMIHNADITGHQIAEEGIKILFAVTGLNAGLQNLKMNGSGGLENTDLPGNAWFSVQEAGYHFPDGYYSVLADAIEFSGENRSFSIRNSKFKPLLTPQTLPEALGHEVDHFDIVSGPISISGIDTEKLQNGQFITETVSIDGLSIFISRDKNFADKPRSEDLLIPVKFVNLPVGISVDSVKWNNGLISYREWIEGQTDSGDVKFDDVDILLTNFQNLDNSNPLLINATSRFLGATDMDVKFEFMLDEKGTHHISGSLSGFDLEKINPVLVPLATSRIRSGNMDSFTFNYTLDDEKAEGSVLIIYDNLEIRLLDSKTLDESKRNRLASFFANLVMISSDNPAANPKEGEIYLERDAERSMFTYWWKSLQTGIESSVGM